MIALNIQIALAVVLSWFMTLVQKNFVCFLAVLAEKKNLPDLVLPKIVVRYLFVYSDSVAEIFLIS